MFDDYEENADNEDEVEATKKDNVITMDDIYNNMDEDY